MARVFKGKSLDAVAFPMGGLGAGSVCMKGNGGLGTFSLWNRPNMKDVVNCYSAVTVCADTPATRLLETKIPDYVYLQEEGAWNGLFARTYGLPRFENGEFSSRFPFAVLKLTDSDFPIAAEITGWSPFIPGNEDDSGFPFAALEYTITNVTEQELSLVYYFNCENFIDRGNPNSVKRVKNGFVFYRDGTEENPELEAAFCASLSESAYLDTAWFRGGWFDTPTMVWNGVTRGAYRNAAYPDPENGGMPGATLAVPFTLKGGESKTIKLRLSWYAPNTDIRTGKDTGEEQKLPRRETYKPWYTTVLDSIEQANEVWDARYTELREKTKLFTDTFYSSTLPEPLIEAAAANLSILKSPTILRQTDGRLWGWEGCQDYSGVCDGSCTHVWNYAQSICHLFPRLERSLRQSEFYEAQSDETGHQEFRVYLPIRKAEHNFHAASDGQLGGIMKIYRDWCISGDTDWLRSIWPRVKESMEFCIKQWDSKRSGIIDKPHHNTYDIEFYGSDGMSMSFYLGAIKAFCVLKEAMGENPDEYRKLFENGKAFLENELYNGEYFYQKPIWKAEDYANLENADTISLCSAEGPKYQYGTGCLSDGIMGVWMAELFGLSDIVDNEKVDSSLASIYKYNFHKNLRKHANPQRPGYATANDGGLVLCSWPHGGKPSLPFIYSDEIWCGIEYQVASHLISHGKLKEGTDIVEACRERYNGTVRNPYNEYECGYWYARSMASYSLLQAYSGVRYNAVEKTLYYRTNNSSDYTTFLSTEKGYGLVTVNGGKATLQTVSGVIPVEKYVEVDSCNHIRHITY